MENKEELTKEEKINKLLEENLEDLEEIIMKDGCVNIDKFEEAFILGTEEGKDRDLEVEAVTKIVTTFKRIMREEMMYLLKDNLD